VPACGLHCTRRHVRREVAFVPVERHGDCWSGLLPGRISGATELSARVLACQKSALLPFGRVTRVGMLGSKIRPAFLSSLCLPALAIQGGRDGCADIHVSRREPAAL